jgi:hypothetical protein
MGLKETETTDSMPLIGSHLLKFSYNCDSDSFQEEIQSNHGGISTK